MSTDAVRPDRPVFESSPINVPIRGLQRHVRLVLFTFKSGNLFPRKRFLFDFFFQIHFNTRQIGFNVLGKK